MKNHRKMIKIERDKLYEKVIKTLQMSQDIQYPIETIKWATTRYVNEAKEL